MLEYESIPCVLSSKPFGKLAKSIDHETEDIITVEDITNKVLHHNLVIFYVFFC